MAEAMEHHGNGSGNGSGHEHREANVKLIVYSSVGLAISVVIVCVIVWGIFKFFEANSAREASFVPPAVVVEELPPGPKLQVHPSEELQDLHAREEKVLGTYGWVDQKQGLVHIPIDKAMDAVAGKLPMRPESTPAAKPPAKPAAPAAPAQ
ncbi:MAG TPA: hypothetical protein VKU01_32085 [Bryobacteraceae bacterium]|nr:hypothetical protein [Bryobacteraceae bacterium]